MSWFTKDTENVTQYMNITRVENITYKDLEKILGQPDEVKFYDVPERAKDVLDVKWVIAAFGYKFRIKPDESFFTEKKLEAGERSWVVPSLDSPKINAIEILGHRKLAQNVISTLLLAEAGKYNKLSSKDFQTTIKTIFGDN